MSVYAVELEWYDDALDDMIHPNKCYFFDCADKALEFASKLSFYGSWYRKYGMPHDVYMFKLEDYEGVKCNIDDTYVAKWGDLDKKRGWIRDDND